MNDNNDVMPVISDVCTVYVTVGNTDMTEGKGLRYPLYISDLETTARRLGLKNGFGGSDCDVAESKAYRVGNNWYHSYLNSISTEEDIKKDAINKRRLEIAERIKGCGISQGDLDLLLIGK